MNQFVRAVVVAGVVLCLPGCLEDKQAEIDKLVERVEDLEDEVEDLERDLKQAEEDTEEARKETSAAEDLADDAERELSDAERELARYRKAEERAKVEAEAEPSAREKIEIAKKKAEESLAAVVTVTGGGKKGRGFVMEVDGKTWLYMAASTLAGSQQLEFHTADETKLTKFGAFEMASGADLARLEIQDEVASKLTAGELTAKGRLIGVSEGGTSIVEGRSYDEDGETMRVDSRIGAGLPGGPMFDGESGELVGILTVAKEEERTLWEMDRSRMRAQPVMLRLDKKTEWAATNIGSFLKEGQRIADTDRLTRLVTAIAAIDPMGGGASLAGGVGSGWSMEKVFEENPEMRVITELKEIEEWLASRKLKPSERDVKKRYSSVFGQVGSASRRQMQEFDPAKFSPYYREAAKQSAEWRKEAEEELANVVKALGS